MPPIVFTDDDFHDLDHQQDDPMVIIVEIENYAVKKVLVDQGSSVDNLYWATYQKLQLPDTAMIPYDEPIYGFSGEQVSHQNHPNPLPYCRCANILQHHPGPSFLQYTWRSRLHPSLGHEVPCPIR